MSLSFSFPPCFPHQLRSECSRQYPPVLFLIVLCPYRQLISEQTAQPQLYPYCADPGPCDQYHSLTPRMPLSQTGTHSQSNNHFRHVTMFSSWRLTTLCYLEEDGLLGISTFRRSSLSCVSSPPPHHNKDNTLATATRRHAVPCSMGRDNTMETWRSSTCTQFSIGYSLMAHSRDRASEHSSPTHLVFWPAPHCKPTLVFTFSEGV